MEKNWENKEIGEIGLVTLTPGIYPLGCIVVYEEEENKEIFLPLWGFA